MWILYGLLAATSFGVAAILQKLAARGVAVATSVWNVLIFQGLATIAIGIIGFLLTRQAFARQESPAYLYAALTGAALTVGALFIFLTYRAADAASADASRIQALINTNTLVAVVLGLLVLKEYTHLHTPGDWARLIVGAVLVVAGGILVSWPPDPQPAGADLAVRARHTVVHSHATHAHGAHSTIARNPKLETRNSL